MTENLTNKKKQKNPAFAREARLNCLKDLQKVKRKGRSAAGKFCIIKALKTPPDSNRRVAFLISRRFDLSAVKRNRARRLFREVFRQIYPDLAPAWLLFIPKKQIKAIKTPELLADICLLIDELELWKDR